MDEPEYTGPFCKAEVQKGNILKNNAFILGNYVLLIFQTFHVIKVKKLTQSPAESIIYLVKNHYKRALKVNKVKNFRSEYRS